MAPRADVLPRAIGGRLVVVTAAGVIATTSANKFALALCQSLCTVEAHTNDPFWFCDYGGRSGLVRVLVRVVRCAV